MAEEEKKLNFYNWDTYIGENTLADFNDATGIEVKMDLYRRQRRALRQAQGRQPRL